MSRSMRPEVEKGRGISSKALIFSSCRSRPPALGVGALHPKSNVCVEIRDVFPVHDFHLRVLSCL